MVQYSGIYVSDEHFDHENDLKYYRYLRFYADGVVLEVTSMGQPHEVVRWFERDNPRVAKGFFATNEEGVTHFAVTTEYGVVVFEAEFQGERLCVDIYSHIKVAPDDAGVRTASDQFRFIYLPEIQPVTPRRENGTPPGPNHGSF
jgi:hypothetical protein